MAYSHVLGNIIPATALPLYMPFSRPGHIQPYQDHVPGVATDVQDRLLIAVIASCFPRGYDQ
jgi:hypothetical protein